MSKYFIPTLNKTGYALSEVLDDISKEFVEYSKHLSAPILEIGAAFGVVTLECLRHGATIIANDIDPNHLKEIQKKCENEKRKNLILMPGDFENLSILNESLSAILCCRVIHFFDPDKVMRSIRKAHSWLESGGKVFFTVESPYLKNWNNLPHDFNVRKISGDKFPGYIRTKEYINNGAISDNLPEYMQFFDEEVLANIFDACGFQIEKSYLFGRPYFPEEVQLDGRESVGIIAVKN